MRTRTRKQPQLRDVLPRTEASPVDMTIIDTSRVDRTAEAKRALARLEEYCRAVRAVLYARKAAPEAALFTEAAS